MDEKLLVYCLQVIVGGFVAVLWANFREVKALAEKNSEQLGVYKVLAVEKFATKTDLGDVLHTVTRNFDNYTTKLDIRLDRIESKIDGKMDKP